MSDYDYEDDYGEHKQEFMSEVNFYERTMVSSPLNDCIGIAPTDERERKQWIRKLTEQPRFCYVLQTEVLPELEPLYGKVNQDALVEKMELIQNVKFLSPWGYVLGAIVTDNGKRLNKETFNEVVSSLPNNLVTKYGIQPPDILRYARYWMRL